MNAQGYRRNSRDTHQKMSNAETEIYNVSRNTMTADGFVALFEQILREQGEKTYGFQLPIKMRFSLKK